MSLVADQVHHRLSSKRKFDDYAGPNDGDYDCDNDNDDDDQEEAFSSDLVPVRMRRDEPDAAESSSFSFPSAAAAVESRVSDAKSASYRCGSDGVYSGRPPSALQFFIRTMSGGKSLVIHADSGDSVRSLHERIAQMTGVPAYEQRLIYCGRQLQWEQSLGECGIENDAGLQLVGRLRSTVSPQAWQVLDDMIFAVCRLCRGESVAALKDIKSYMTEYFSIIPYENGGAENVAVTVNHLQIFLSSSAPAALVMLYASDSPTNKEYGENSIKLFLNLARNLSVVPYSQCAPVLLEFCTLLRRVGTDDSLYVSCRNALGCLLESNKMPSSSSGGEALVEVKDIFPFVTELAFSLSRDLILSKDSSLNATGPLPSDVRDFAAFLGPLRDSVSNRDRGCGRVSEHPSVRNEVDFLHGIFVELLIKMEDCLRKMEEVLVSNAKANVDMALIRWCQYLPILKELNSTSKLYQGAEEKLWTLLRSRKASFQTLIIKYAKVIEDNLWILTHKEVLNFESRRHLVMLMFPDVKEDYEELHEMLIDRTQLLEESFEYIGNAKQEELHRDLFMEFKNEEATGPGVLREWFVLVCQALFDPQRALFVSCPNDCRRFYPNQASKIEPMHLEYFRFAGRIIALTLMHKVQVGVVFDRAFFKQFAGNSLITLEDIRDADPCLYNSCKQILQMDAEFIDSDSLGLTFVREVDELGSIKPVELCPGGKNIVVNSQNREEYVNLLIQHQFVLSISDLVTRFMSGFSDVLAKTEYRASFFQTLELEDLDLMLHGSEVPVSVEDWKAHTEYNGYKETDAQITWFWKIVEEMPAEQRKALLFFWTSIKYLPVEGFRGLQSRLHIYKTPEPVDRLPSSHTCFYRLCFPPYPSKAVLQKRIHIITQEHFGSSFGTW